MLQIKWSVRTIAFVALVHDWMEFVQEISSIKSFDGQLAAVYTMDNKFVYKLHVWNKQSALEILNDSVALHRI